MSERIQNAFSFRIYSLFTETSVATLVRPGQYKSKEDIRNCDARDCKGPYYGAFHLRLKIPLVNASHFCRDLLLSIGLTVSNNKKPLVPAAPSSNQKRWVIPSAASRTLLHRRTPHIAIRAENAAIIFSRLKHHAAARALVEILARILGHDFALPMSARWTRDRRRHLHR